jgi:hypothetical protein
MRLQPARWSLSASFSRIVRTTGVCVGVGAVGIWLFSSLGAIESRSATASNEPQYPFKERFFAAVPPGAIDRLEIVYPSGTEHELRRGTDGWEILDGSHWFPVNPDREATLLAALAGEGHSGIPGIIQGSNPANHQRAFSVSASCGILVSFFAGERLVEQLVVGRAVEGTAGWGTYVRRPDSNAVYQIPGKLTECVSGESVYTWRRRFLFPNLSPSEVESITVTAQEATASYSLARTPGTTTGWSVTVNGARRDANPVIADALCEWITRLRTADFLEEAAETAQNDVALHVELGISGYELPVTLTARRDQSAPGIVRLGFDSPQEQESDALGVFDLLPLQRDASELVWTPPIGPGTIVDKRPGANEPFALGAGEKLKQR